ncbi:GNAT family N-acetyltransferase, partial [Rathayibacter rathayi]
MTVRRASPADADALAELAAATFPLACPPHTTAEAKA